MLSKEDHLVQTAAAKMEPRRDGGQRDHLATHTEQTRAGRLHARTATAGERYSGPEIQAEIFEGESLGGRKYSQQPEGLALKELGRILKSGKTEIK